MFLTSSPFAINKTFRAGFGSRNPQFRLADIWWCLLGPAVPEVNSSRIVIAMADIWWSLLGAAVPAIIAAHTVRVKRRRAEEQRLQKARGREKHSDEIFVCMRVCTSKRMLKKDRLC
ncbi:hypothetical protein OPV22_016843 [Ensete ventricosum]|uniref:Uncharacterized protein n=1 Tax=Ensete ventricosum TaxID=4639 RepID=A0AAV8QUY2_ENSVE|nr:hypothetical protein OPV22_016843 [Ensete ventricosum]